MQVGHTSLLLAVRLAIATSHVMDVANHFVFPGSGMMTSRYQNC